MVTSVATSAHTLPATSSAPAKKFVDLCIEDLSPKRISSLKCTRGWQITACATMVVAYIALAVGAFIATGVLAPIYLPYASIAAVIIAIPYADFVEKIYSASRHAKSEIVKYKDLQHVYQNLTRQPPENLQLILLRMGIIWNHIPGMQIQHPENLSSLNPLIAQAKFSEAQIQRYTNDMQSVIDEANRLETADPVANRVQINQYRKAALETENGILHAKIQAAFTNAVLRKPDTTGTLSDLGSVSSQTFEDRLLQNAANNAADNTFLEFKNRDIAPITVVDVKTMSVAQLGERLFAAMAA